MSMKIAAAVLACAAWPFSQAADSAPGAFPTRPITVVYPAAPGGAGDPILRLILGEAQKKLGTNLIVENKPGGAFTIGAKAVLNAPPDGYTLLAAFPGHINMKPFMKLPYDPIRNFVPVAKLTASNLWFVVRADLPVKTFPEFIAYAKQHPLNAGTLANGSQGHVFMERLNQQYGLKVVSAFYRGDAPVLTDLVGGQLDMCLCSSSSAGAFVRSGKLRALATTAPRRSEQAPDLPTFKELGYTDSQFEYATWLGMFAPEHTPPDRVAVIVEALRFAMQQPAVLQLTKANASEVDFRVGDAFTSFLEKSAVDWESDVKRSGIKLE